MAEENMERCSVSCHQSSGKCHSGILHFTPALGWPGKDLAVGMGTDPGNMAPSHIPGTEVSEAARLGHSLAASHGGSGCHTTQSSMPKAVPKRKQTSAPKCVSVHSHFTHSRKKVENSPSVHQRLNGKIGRGL